MATSMDIIVADNAEKQASVAEKTLNAIENALLDSHLYQWSGKTRESDPWPGTLQANTVRIIKECRCRDRIHRVRGRTIASLDAARRRTR
jgi:hypothetical protein